MSVSARDDQRCLGVGLHGLNGHQVHRQLVGHRRARLVATSACVLAATEMPAEAFADARRYQTLDELLADPAVELVSLCSPRRADQAKEAIRCLQAGRHVYAEKPCALTEADLDRILAAANAADRRFHEMAGTLFERPYPALAGVARSGALGQLVQVTVQKSYPYHSNRPQDEAVDGGLLLQVGIHAVRLIEHVAGLRIERLAGVQTRRGNPVPGDLRMAASLHAQLIGGGVGTITLNYLNQHSAHSWGHDELRIFGTDGFAESNLSTRLARLVPRNGPAQTLTDVGPAIDYFDLVVAEILDGSPMPMPLDVELHPLRVLLRAEVHTSA